MNKQHSSLSNTNNDEAKASSCNSIEFEFNNMHVPMALTDQKDRLIIVSRNRAKSIKMKRDKSEVLQTQF